MALRLAPYNNGMRLGQGFNSYTQQICVDDAVVTDPDRIDNPVTNDGFTMRDLRFAISGAHTTHSPSSEESGDAVLVSPAGEENIDSTALAARSFAFQFQQRAEQIKKLIEDINAYETELEDVSKTETAERRKKALILENKRIKLSKLKTLEVTEALKSADSKGLAEELANRGRSQVVTYTSRFVSKLSEVTDEMNISGSLSIKYGAIGGSGKGSFIDSDKFKESDLNFFISVKVINQSINIKDALIYQALPSVDEKNFVDVFGDCFISGFLEGGEFNALVSMKVLNKDKKTEIEAQAKVAMTIGPVELEAEAKVKVAKNNIQANTETTIQVGWSGGGSIKPMDEPWSIDTLMQTAAKFPDLVAKTPQRTYAILTKYEALRSFMVLKPEKLSPIMYENAAIYTNALLDAYMDYKNIYRNISSDLFDIDAGTKKFDMSMDTGTVADNTTLTKVDDESNFSASYKGMELARRACRFQMMKIVTEVDLVTSKPALSTDETRGEQFQSPVSFRQRLPKVVLERTPRKLQLFGDEEQTYHPLLEGESGSKEEADKVASLVADKHDISEHLRLAPPIGSDEGTLFCNLDFVKPTFALLQVIVEISDRGVVSGMRTRYSNGLVTNLGAVGSGKQVTLNLHPEDGERVFACSIEVGRPTDEANAKERVTAVRLYTNRGPDLMGQADNWQPSVEGKGQRGNTSFEGLTLRHYDPLLAGGHLKGFWGRSINTSTSGKRTGLYRMGPIWGDTQDDSAVVAGLESGDDNEQDRPKTGGVRALDIGWKLETNMTRSTTVRFEKSLASTPRVLYGLRQMDIIAPHGPNIAVETLNLGKEGFDLKLQSWNSLVYNTEANWLTLPSNSNINFQYGELDSSELPGRAPTQNASFRVYFAKPYKTEPKVQCWFTSIVQPKGWRSLRCTVSNVTRTACTVTMETWAGRQFDRAKVMWLAWDSEYDGKNVRSGTNFFKKDTPIQDHPWYNGPFAKQPVVFGALCHIDFPEQATNLRCYSNIIEATKERLKWQAGTWADTTMDTTGMVWIGMD
ncbi:hypothetical protein FSPOR_11795 [Fusarium sporotrichioides]|uniref:H-type lectin domain-containing protein n=1 Tax=Fusarium sporotrichioides TaxID=5514 RepID=A0A395RFB3_FUSSP|nr:hypothetical protein FSPOR_11795 [Fusarium sporotrichioides]